MNILLQMEDQEVHQVRLDHLDLMEGITKCIHLHHTGKGHLQVENQRILI